MGEHHTNPETSTGGNLETLQDYCPRQGTCTGSHTPLRPEWLLQGAIVKAQPSLPYILPWEPQPPYVHILGTSTDIPQCPCGEGQCTVLAGPKGAKVGSPVLWLAQRSALWGKDSVAHQGGSLWDKENQSMHFPEPESSLSGAVRSDPAPS